MLQGEFVWQNLHRLTDLSKANRSCFCLFFFLLLCTNRPRRGVPFCGTDKITEVTLKYSEAKPTLSIPSKNICRKISHRDTQRISSYPLKNDSVLNWPYNGPVVETDTENSEDICHADKKDIASWCLHPFIHSLTDKSSLWGMVNGFIYETKDIDLKLKVTAFSSDSFQHYFS